MANDQDFVSPSIIYGKEGFASDNPVSEVSTDKPSKTFIVNQAKKAINFQFKVIIAFVADAVSGVIFAAIGLALAGIYNVVFCVIAIIAVKKRKEYRSSFFAFAVKITLPPPKRHTARRSYLKNPIHSLVRRRI
ncbi:MAG: DUF4870 domain-containing protein [Helicobacteraceae bacterium]|nr:DUF4870 domain-containing protein [Helicobacteraceae bacterium]